MHLYTIKPFVLAFNFLLSLLKGRGQDIVVQSICLFVSFFAHRDAHTPQPGEIASDTMSYRKGETVQKSGDFQNRQFKLCKSAGEITFSIKTRQFNLKMTALISKLKV